MPAKDLPALKLALLKHAKVGDIARLPRAQRDVLQKYNAALSGAAYKTTQSFMAIAKNIKDNLELEGEVVTEELQGDPPMVLVLRRKGIRTFPNGRNVALYTNENLGLTFTVPYNSPNKDNTVMSGVTEQVEDIYENLNHLQTIVKTKEPKELKFKTGETHKVDPMTADAILKVHGHKEFSDDNKITLNKMISHSPDSFKKVAVFALKNITHKAKDA